MKKLNLLKFGHYYDHFVIIGGLLLNIALVLFIFMIFTGQLFAQGSPSAKASAQVGSIGILNSQQLNWSTIMSNKIKTANSKDLFILVSLECGLMTNTKVQGKKGSSDTSSANASVKLRVLVDGFPAKPGEVTFCKRTQALSAVLGGVLESCTDHDGDGTIFAEDCEFTDETIELLLDTMQANSFGFILDDMKSGEHMIDVQARIDSGSSSQAGSAEASGSIGKGSLSIEEVRFVNKGADINL